MYSIQAGCRGRDRSQGDKARLATDTEVGWGLQRKLVEDARVRREAIVALLQRSIDQGGTTLRDYRNVDGDKGAFASQLNAYGQQGKPCRRCGTSLRNIIVATRSTTFCPRCQRKPSPKT